MCEAGGPITVDILGTNLNRDGLLPVVVISDTHKTTRVKEQVTPKLNVCCVKLSLFGREAARAASEAVNKRT